MSNSDNPIKIVANSIPGLKTVVRWRRESRQLREYWTWAPPGHFYSPIPSAEQVERQKTLQAQPPPKELPGIDLNIEGQLRVVEEMKPFHDELPFADEKKEGLRYYYKNTFFEHADAVFLYGMIRRLAPKRIIEIGAGFSSAVMLDTNDTAMGGNIEMTFVEPYPERLLSIMRESDKKNTRIITTNLEELDLSLFNTLEANDILFVDSSHVSKAGSDVNTIFFDILPRLKPGVRVHVHDIMYPFEYPYAWLKEGRAWNETYLLRAFLQHNSAFKIEAWAHYLDVMHPEALKANLPVALQQAGGGGSIWLHKVA
jgi:predicted O-methyltransferase YrrM